ncbi:MAG: hypothetical protein ACI4EF_09060 [Coprococcus sp.]
MSSIDILALVMGIIAIGIGIECIISEFIGKDMTDPFNPVNEESKEDTK